MIIGSVEFLSCHLSIILICVNMFCRYPEARAIQRKIIFHAGPTNSGKTYHAIQRYLEAKSGVYCGPLKLLAHEIFEKSNSAVSFSPQFKQRYLGIYVNNMSKICLYNYMNNLLACVMF